MDETDRYQENGLPVTFGCSRYVTGSSDYG